MAKHNATGRSSQLSKAQRQAAMNPNNKQTNTPTPAQVPATTEQPKADAPANVVAINPNKGAAMRTRWSACLKKRPGAKLYMAGDIKALPKDSQITSLVAGNPKKQHAADRYTRYGFNMVKGATTTIEKYVAAVKKIDRDWATEGIAYADIAWDINHEFIQVDVAVIQPMPEPEPEPTAQEVTETQDAIDAEPIDPTEDNEPEPIVAQESITEESPATVAESEAPRPNDAWATTNEVPPEVESEAA